MPSGPYPVSGRVFESDGSTVLGGARVILTNSTNNETQAAVTNSSGEFVIDAANFTSGYLDGDQLSLYCAYGNAYDERYLTIDTTIGFSSQNLTLSNTITAAPTYASIAEVRRYAGVDSSEFSDAAVHDFIKSSTALIDELTGRTWKGIQTSTLEFFDGDGTDILWLNKADIQEISAVQIDDDTDGTYSSVSSDNTNTSSGAWVYSEGYIILDDGATINRFTAGPKTVRVTYTYGNKRPTELVRQLCMAIVANMMNFNRDRQAWIDDVTQELKFKGPMGLA